MKNKWFKIMALLFVLTIVTLQFVKRDNQIKENKAIELEKLSANSRYVDLLNKIPVYRDSIFSIYISNIDGTNEIVYLKWDSITERQKTSKFFLHIYPVDKKILGSNKLGNLAYDFKSNFQSFNYFNKSYFVTSTILPDFLINKINTGQYGYEGDGSISWKVKSLLLQKDINRVILANKEKKVNIFREGLSQ